MSTLAAIVVGAVVGWFVLLLLVITFLRVCGEEDVFGCDCPYCPEHGPEN